MPKLTVLVGPPGSGKSTIRSELVSQPQVGTTIGISQDDQGRTGHAALFAEALKAGCNIVVDRMNFSREQRARYTEPARKAGYEIEIRVLQVPYDMCLSRMVPRWCKDSEFGYAVTHPTISTEKHARDALHTFYTKYERPSPDEADIVQFQVGNADQSTDQKPGCIIVDLDGTLCNADHRLHHVRKEGGKKPDWKSFFAGIADDPINEWCDILVRGIGKDSLVRVVMCSGRPDDYRKTTENWLDKHLGYSYYDELFMRRRGDFRRDDVVKEIILDFEILPRYNVLFAVDDRQQVVDLWRRKGITALQCAPGNF